MLRKLLLLLLIGFAFTEINAQDNIGINFLDCAVAPNDNITREYRDYQGDISGDGITKLPFIDGKISYVRMNDIEDTAVTNPFGTGLSATLATTTGAGIRWSIANMRWEIYGGATVVSFHMSDTTVPPGDGWTYNTGCPTGGVTLTLTGETGGVLPVNREEFSNMSLYPNPATGFVSISNLDELSNVRITNIAGQVVLNTRVDRNDNRIDIQELAKGFYFVEIEGKKTIKLIKQ